MTTYNVPDMSCGHCKAAIEKAVAEADNTAEITFDMENRTVEINTKLDTKTIAKTLEKQGYPATIA